MASDETAPAPEPAYLVRYGQEMAQIKGRPLPSVQPSVAGHSLRCRDNPQHGIVQTPNTSLVAAGEDDDQV